MVVPVCLFSGLLSDFFTSFNFITGHVADDMSLIFALSEGTHEPQEIALILFCQSGAVTGEVVISGSRYDMPLIREYSGDDIENPG